MASRLRKRARALFTVSTAAVAAVAATSIPDQRADRQFRAGRLTFTSGQPADFGNVNWIQFRK